MKLDLINDYRTSPKPLIAKRFILRYDDGTPFDQFSIFSINHGETWTAWTGDLFLDKNKKKEVRRMVALIMSYLRTATLKE